MNVLRIFLIGFVVLSGLGIGTVSLAAPLPGESSQHNALLQTSPTATKTPQPTKTPGAEGIGETRIAEAIAKYFDVSASQVMAWHDAGRGWGEIVKAYALAEASGKSVEDIFAMRAHEKGWGVILKDLAVTKWNTNLGKIMRNPAADKNSNDVAPGKSGERRNDQDKGKPENPGKGKNK